MAEHLKKELEELKLQTLTMTSEVKQALTKACNAFKNLDADVAQEIIEQDDRINELELKIDEKALRLLALEGPVARDLRFILGCMRIAIDLERIGDECANIAHATIILSCKPPLPFYKDINILGEKAKNMLDLAVNAFFQPNSDLAIEVCKLDFEVDELHSSITEGLITYMTEYTPAIKRSIQAINITKRFERVADLATNISESAVFVDKGVNIRHYCQFDNR
ncbi:MAG: phosphate signaling complex protein PhoU [Desulfonauticus sp.]|nr:phosphate signaling complex protein PhoU [Desulfonauticus sp.]